jgi:hypothetical protein
LRQNDKSSCYLASLYNIAAPFVWVYGISFFFIRILSPPFLILQQSNCLLEYSLTQNLSRRPIKHLGVFIASSRLSLTKEDNVPKIAEKTEI